MITLAKLVQAIAPGANRRLSGTVLAQPVTAITSDSRQVVPGSLFVAVRGVKTDGRRYIPEAIGKGCLAVVVDVDEGVDEWNVPVLLVDDCPAALGELAAAWNGYPASQMQLVAITGTNGKTTCSWLIEEMLVASGFRPGVIGTVNYRYHGADGLHIIQDAPLTTPDPVTLQGLLRTMADNGVTHVIMEVSSHALQQQRLGSTRFDVALFTNLSRDHLDYHQSMEVYFEAKKQLFHKHLKEQGVAVVVLGPQAEGCDWGGLLTASLPAEQVIRCGLHGSCEVSAHQLTQTMEGFRCCLHLRGAEVNFASPLTGEYNVLNVLAAAGVGLGLGLVPDRFLEGLARVGRVPGRLERVRLPGEQIGSGPAVFVDYAHTPDALDNVLRNLKKLTTGRLLCVFGCGGDRDRGKRPLMGRVAAQLADAVVVTSDNPRTEAPEAIIDEIVAGVEAGGKSRTDAWALLNAAQPVDGYTVIADRRCAITAACSLAAPGDSVLLAGKGHETYQIIGTEKHFFDDRQEATNGLLHWNERHLLAATSGKVAGGTLCRVLASVCTDSRQLRPGDIFVALKGEAFDGHQYIEAAAEQRAGAIVAEWMPPRMRPEVLYIEVKDSLRALGDLAAYRRRLLNGTIKVAAITGSSGKTTVKEMVASIFAEALQGSRTGMDAVLKTRGNFNNLVGLPLSLLPLEAGHRLAVVEMGMNVPGEIARLVAIADPDIGCINNVHPAHLQGLGSLAGVAAAKGELFAGMRPEAVRVVNLDDPHVRAQAKKFAGEQIGFAVTPSGRKFGPQVRATRPDNLGEQGMRFTLHIEGWRARVTVPVFGAHNVSNCVAAAAIAHAAGIGPEVIAQGLQRYAPSVDKRLAVTELPGGLKVVNDAYNANPASMAAGLRTVAAFGHRGCRHLAALGDMLELGAASEDLHAGIGALVASLGYDFLALTGMQATVMARAASAAGMKEENIRVFANPRAMADWIYPMLARGDLAAGDWLLIKGSRGMRMEQLLDELEQRLNNSKKNVTE
ncbi:UDP-N-acetylmuramyl-tripeptide synthetase [Desulfobulbus propionicus DSM 2032]|uniref:Multifunctional fusion protein n=1 Tax=Desulfobulbus propionicus (strain ATCC 33891 / DSM 2032 / VKM B-1956 / 1pr3) TaxID=577650 RepID=A0A7U3YK50_DESPD|nr:UDP-N-acetylmuramoyl-L-alanyl-D-glutamate--2,6-diaminopimelate ligase [Desulfobulbus propionicus]ADW16866.1 UDP-N-acetylmuramyl-tripeptide synthetase [Desulfobulbus propionicus DSM 2032]